jgi:D-inositol-3-phosphate glycosyltransferase
MSFDMPQQLKIAMLSVHSCPLGLLGGRDTGGMNVYIRELAQELGKRGHAVDIYTMEHQPQHQHVINLGRNVRLIHLETGGNEDMPKVAIYAYLQSLICGVENFRKSDSISYDLIHSHYWLSGLVGKQLQVWWHVPHLVMYHTLGAVKNSIGIGEDETELRIESERELVTDCDRIIASTEREKAELIRHYGASPGKIAIVPCGVNLHLFQPIDRETAREELNLNHQKVILFVGRIEPLKGLDQLLRALTHLNGKESPLLLIVGGDEYSQGQVEVLQKMAGELRIDDRITFAGSVSQEKLPLFYSAADVCVIPSYHESFGMVALESLACGTPIVATDVGGMRQIIRRNEMGRIVSDNSPQKLAGEIYQLLFNGDRGQHVRLRRDTMVEFGWPTIADRILHEYNRLLKDYHVNL